MECNTGCRVQARVARESAAYVDCHRTHVRGETPHKKKGVDGSNDARGGGDMCLCACEKGGGCCHEFLGEGLTDRT